MANEDVQQQWHYEKARIEFYLIWLNRLGRDPMVMDEDRWIVQDFVKWLIKDETSSLDLKKGILFCGTQGCGKSELMMAGSEFCRMTKIRKYGFKRIGDIFLEISMNGGVKSIDPYLRGNWCFDDIGQMNEDVVVYSKLNIVETLINARISKPFLTLGTTNLLADEIRGKYGDIVASRFNQMFNIVQFSSLQDFRKL